jgi:hypothetical protein
MDSHDQRVRQAQIREKLRILLLDRPLLLDFYYLSGSLNPWQWDAGHLFREARLLLVESRSRGQVRKRADDGKPRKLTGFSMLPVAIERTLALERWIDPDYLDSLLGLIGEKQIRVELPQAQRSLTALAEWYGIRPARVPRMTGHAPTSW